MKEKQTNETNGKKVNDCVTFMVLAIIIYYSEFLFER